MAYKRRSAQADEATALQAKARRLAVLDDGGLQVVDIERADLDRAAALCDAHASGYARRMHCTPRWRSACA